MGQSVAKGIAWLSVSRIVIQLLTFVSTLYIARVLGPSEYSLMAIGMLVIGFMEKFSELGFGMAIVQKEALADDELHTVYWCTVLTGAAVSLLCYASSPYIEMYFLKSGVGSIIKTLSVCLGLQSICIVPFKLMERHLRFEKTAIVEISSKFVSLSSSICFVYFGFGVWALVYGQVLRVLTFCVLTFSLSPFMPKLVFRLDSVKETLCFGLNIVGLRFAWYGRNQIDLFLGARYLSAVDFGYYSFAFQLVRPVQDVIQGVMSTVSVPLMARSQKSDEALNSTYLKALKFSVLLAGPLFLGGCILGQQLIYVFLGAKWLLSSPIFQAACLIVLLRLMLAPNEDILLSMGKLGMSIKINLVVLLFLFFILSFCTSAGTMAYSLLAAMIVIYFVWTFVLIKERKIQMRAYWCNIWGVVRSVGVMAGVVMLSSKVFFSLDPSSSRLLVGFQLAALVSIGACVYVGFIRIFDRSFFASFRPGKILS